MVVWDGVVVVWDGVVVVWDGVVVVWDGVCGVCCDKGRKKAASLDTIREDQEETRRRAQTPRQGKPGVCVCV